jgi:hypothetical protein
MSPIDSRAKGKKGELEFINQHLVPCWPEAKRNIDQFGDDKRDCIVLNGVHWQIKRTEALRLYDAIAQAENEAAATDLPVVAFRRNHAPWRVVVDAGEFVALLRLREASSGEDCEHGYKAAGGSFQCPACEMAS